MWSIEDEWSHSTIRMSLEYCEGAYTLSTVERSMQYCVALSDCEVFWSSVHTLYEYWAWSIVDHCPHFPLWDLVWSILKPNSHFPQLVCKTVTTLSKLRMSVQYFGAVSTLSTPWLIVKYCETVPTLFTLRLSVQYCVAEFTVFTILLSMEILWSKIHSLHTKNECRVLLSSVQIIHSDT